MPGGRPSKLTQELLEKAREYVLECKENKNDIQVRRGLDEHGDTRWEQTAPRLPNLNRLALVCGIHKGTLYRWRDGLDSDGNEIEKEEGYMALLAEFRNLCEHIESLQELCLVEEGSAGRLNPAVATRIMATKHGYVEKIESNNNTNLSVLTDDLKRLGDELKDAITKQNQPEAGTAEATSGGDGVLPGPAPAVQG